MILKIRKGMMLMLMVRGRERDSRVRLREGQMGRLKSIGRCGYIPQGNHN